MAAARARAEATSKPRPDAYVGLLGLSLLALITAMVFAYLNWGEIKDKPKEVRMPAAGAGRGSATPGPATAPGAPAPGAVAPGAAAPGGAAVPVPPGGNPAPPAPPQ